MSDFLKALLSGGLGAIIVLILKQYIDYRGTMYKRLLRHNDSLVLLELRLMDIDSALHDNRIIFKQIIDGVKKRQILIGRPEKMYLENSFFKDSLLLELNNKLHSFRYRLRRINCDIGNFNRSYNLLADAVTLDRISSNIFIQHINGLLAEKDILLNAFDELQEECVNLIGYVQSRLKIDNNWLMRHKSKILNRSLRVVSSDEVKKSVGAYLKSIETDSEKNRDE